MHLGDILLASDHLSHAINSYEKIVDGKMETTPQKQAPARKGRFCLWSCEFVLWVCVVSVATKWCLNVSVCLNQMLDQYWQQKVKISFGNFDFCLLNTAVFFVFFFYNFLSLFSCSAEIPHGFWAVLNFCARATSASVEQFHLFLLINKWNKVVIGCLFMYCYDSQQCCLIMMTK